jgi:O-methyltransferase
MDSKKLESIKNSAYKTSEIEYDGKKLNFSVDWSDQNDQYKYEHSFIFPKSTLSPWFKDNDFFNHYLEVRNHTLVDMYRCYELWQLTSQYKNKPGVVIEVGVWRGGTGALLAKAAGENTKVYLCDTFEGVVKATQSDAFYKGGEHKDTDTELVRALMNKLNLTNFEILKGIFPEDTGKEFGNQQIKVCHIDVDTYLSAKDVFEYIWPMMVTGGCVIFDDFGFSKMEGVTALVYEIMEKHSDALMLHNLNGHAVIIKVPA